MKKLLLVPLLLMLLVFSGCMLTSASDLYMLPEPAEGFVNLENKLAEVIALGAEYSAPLKGNNRQAVQLVDLNGDDVEEAVAFFRLYDQDKPLRMYIFKLKNNSYERQPSSKRTAPHLTLSNTASLTVWARWNCSSAPE